MKTTPAQIVADALKSVTSYNETLKTTRKLLADDDVKKNDSLRVTLEATFRMATENRDSKVQTIFRRCAEKAGTDEKLLTDLAHVAFPSLKPVVIAPVVSK